MRSRLRAAGTIILTTGLVAALPQLLSLGEGSAARAMSVDQRYPVPASGRYTVRGHGYGHGHGMSQHGAQGAALAGLDHREILDFYYPGTETGTAPKKVRVLISSDTTSDVVVTARSGLKVRDLGVGEATVLPRDLRATQWRIDVAGGNRNVVDYLVGGSWKRWRTLEGEGEFVADGPIELHTPAGLSTFRGRLRAAMPSPTSASRDTVNVVRMNGYVRGVVPYEMPALWEPEAVRAQSVAARTYAAWNRAQYPDRYYQICDTTACQVYRGVNGEHPASNAATAATGRTILTYDGEPAFSQFSASSGGWTAAGSVPYLRAKKDPYDDWPGNTSHDWSVTITKGAIERAYPSIGKLRRILVAERDGNGQWKGRVLSMVLDGRRSDVRISGDDFRWKFGLKSNWFTF
ncbi:MAG TPA: SpoIID/LytB domain-containing protein [Marmoricola sp.]|nr:SpoIID/LytB domain-containing protein [Marmoricola sp.]